MISDFTPVTRVAMGETGPVKLLLMRILSIATSALFLVSSAGVHAQITCSIGPTVGFNASSARHPDASSGNNSYSESTRVSSKIGYEAGLTGTFGRGHFALEPSVRYSQKGFTRVDETTHLVQGPLHTETYRSELQLNYLTLPLQLVFRQQATGQGLQALVGAYLGFLLGGSDLLSYRSTLRPADTKPGVTHEVKAGSKALSYDYTYSKRQDVGVQVGIGYRYQGLLWQAGYSVGLRNLAVDYRPIGGYYTRNFSGPPYYHRVVQASLTYLFDLGGKSRPAS